MNEDQVNQNVEENLNSTKTGLCTIYISENVETQIRFDEYSIDTETLVLTFFKQNQIIGIFTNYLGFKIS